MVTSVVHHTREDGTVVASAPYVRDVDLWAEYFDELLVIAPREVREGSNKERPYGHENVEHLWVEGRSGPGPLKKLKVVPRVPGIASIIIRGVKAANFIQIRLPGDIGLIGLLTTFGMRIPKAVKYSNEWAFSPEDTPAVRFQKRWLRRRWGLRNGVVIVYGIGEKRTGHVIEMPNACYWESEIEKMGIRRVNRPPLGRDCIRLCFVGRLTENKGVDVAIRALARLRGEGFGARLEIVGSGPEQPALQQLVEEVGLRNAVTFKGELGTAEVVEVYQRSHFIVLLSETEGWPRVVHEGMTWGAVPVVTDAGLSRQLVGNGTRGLVVEREPGSVARAIRKVAANASRHEELSEDAIEWATRYTMDLMRVRVGNLLKGQGV